MTSLQGASRGNSNLSSGSATSHYNQDDGRQPLSSKALTPTHAIGVAATPLPAACGSLCAGRCKKGNSGLLVSTEEGLSLQKTVCTNREKTKFHNFVATEV